MTSCSIVDVGFIHLDAGKEAETAEWVAFQLRLIDYTTQLYPYGAAASWEELASYLDMVRASVRFTAILFSYQTPELMGLATSAILQGNSDWILPIRCEDCPQNPMLAGLPHFDVLEVSGGVSSEVAPLIAMKDHMNAVLSPLQDPPCEPFDYRSPARRRWEGPLG